MRARALLSIVSVGSLVSLGLAGGCGGSEDSGPAASSDSGVDAPKEAALDSSAVDTGPDECVDADIRQLAIPDASLGDSGANSAECGSCLKTNCSGDLDVCQGDCPCREGVLKFFNCVGTGKSLQSCAGSLLTAGPTAQSLGACALQSGCADKCGAPSDAGPKNDATTDAPDDGG
jgi:hypothetical protein